MWFNIKYPSPFFSRPSELCRTRLFHRASALELFSLLDTVNTLWIVKAVNFAIEQLKATVPIWKKEVYENGEAQWKDNKVQYLTSNK